MSTLSHPGEIIRELCIEPLGLTVTETAKALGVTRKALSELINGHSGISPEMAIRLSIAFKTSAESWITQQAKYDLSIAEKKRNQLKVKCLVRELDSKNVKTYQSMDEIWDEIDNES